MRLSFALLVLVFVPMACAAPPAQNAGAVATCTREHPEYAVPDEGRAKIGSYLQQRMAVWRTRLSRAECAGNGDAPVIEAERVSVNVHHQGGVDPLVAAGLDAGFDQNGIVSGIIELRRVRDLAAVDEVSAIESEPEPQPNAAR